MSAGRSSATDVVISPGFGWIRSAAVDAEIQIKADVISRGGFRSKFKTHAFPALGACREIFT